MSSSMGSKRKLPPWMLRVPATDQVITSVSEVKNDENGLEELSTDPKSVSTCQSESTKTDLCLVKKCKTTRSRRKLVKQAEDDVSKNMHEGDVEKENYAPSRRKRNAKDLKETRSNAVEESTLSEDELSVDDLISIAKEYINADKRKDGQRSSMAECESERLPQSTSFKGRTTRKDNTPSSVTTLEASSSDLAECQPSERGDVINYSETGDIAQDMIELLLGPLFKRCSKVKPTPEAVTKNVTIEYPSNNQTRDELIRDVVPLARKKGSLKDKVALMLSMTPEERPVGM